MDDDRLHDIRMRIGQSAMESQDLMDSDLGDLMTEWIEKTVELSNALHEREMQPVWIAGFLNGMLLAAVLDKDA